MPAFRAPRPACASLRRRGAARPPHQLLACSPAVRRATLRPAGAGNRVHRVPHREYAGSRDDSQDVLRTGIARQEIGDNTRFARFDSAPPGRYAPAPPPRAQRQPGLEQQSNRVGTRAVGPAQHGPAGACRPGKSPETALPHGNFAARQCSCQSSAHWIRAPGKCYFFAGAALRQPREDPFGVAKYSVPAAQASAFSGFVAPFFAAQVNAPVVLLTDFAFSA